jgi:hypothetical protein
MKRSIFVVTVAYFFIILFLYTGISKWMHFSLFKEEIAVSPILAPVACWIAWGLPLTEIVISIALFTPQWRLKGLYATLALMILFIGYVSGILIMDKHISCSCGGIIEELTPWQHLLFNSICLLLNMAAIFEARKKEKRIQLLSLAPPALLVLVFLVGWLGFTIYSPPSKQRSGFEGKPLPSFSLLLADSLTWFNTADIPYGKSIVILGFSPFCPHCKAEIGDIIKHINSFKDTQFYFVTAFSFKDMKSLYEDFKLSKYDNITAGVDSENHFLEYFKASFVPYTVVYDPKKRLKEVIPGRADMSIISRILTE